MTPAFRTARFDVWHSQIIRSERLGGCPRDIYTAWFHSEDVARPVCEVVIWEQTLYVEWVHVCELYRRQGVAKEVLAGLERHLGVELEMDAVTDAGEAFLAAICNDTQTKETA